MVTYHITITAVGILIYLLGYVICFFSFRHIDRCANGPICLLDYIVIAALSFGSWLAFIVFLIVMALSYNDIIDLDKKCKW